MKSYAYHIEKSDRYSHIEGTIDATSMEIAVEKTQTLLKEIKKLTENQNWHVYKLKEV